MSSEIASTIGQMSGFVVNVDPYRNSAVMLALCGATGKGVDWESEKRSPGLEKLFECVIACRFRCLCAGKGLRQNKIEEMRHDWQHLA